MANSVSKFASRINVLGEGLLSDAQVVVKEFTPTHIDAFNQRVDIPSNKIDIDGIKGLEVGYFAFLFMPILDAAKAYFYSKKIKADPYNKSKLYQRGTLVLHILKAIATLAGVITLIVGVTLGGFLTLAIANAVMSMRSLLKSGLALFNGEYRKAGKHLLNFFVSAAFTASFTIAFVGPILFPAVLAAFPALGWGLAVAATGLGVVSMIWNVAKDRSTQNKSASSISTKGKSLSTQVDNKTTKEELNKVIRKGSNLKSRAEEIMTKFEETHPVTVRDFLQNKLCKDEFEKDLKANIKLFVEGEGAEQGSSPLNLIEMNSQSPFYNKETATEIDKYLHDNVMGTKVKNSAEIQAFYFEQVMGKPLRNLIDESYLYNPNGTECGRNTIATQSFEMLVMLLDAPEYELEFKEYKHYSELRKAAVPLAGALFTLQDKETKDLTGSNSSDKKTKDLARSENFKICKSDYIPHIESAIGHYDKAAKNIIIHSQSMKNSERDIEANVGAEIGHAKTMSV